MRKGGRQNFVGKWGVGFLNNQIHTIIFFSRFGSQTIGFFYPLNVAQHGGRLSSETNQCVLLSLFHSS